MNLPVPAPRSSRSSPPPASFSPGPGIERHEGKGEHGDQVDTLGVGEIQAREKNTEYGRDREKEGFYPGALQLSRAQPLPADRGGTDNVPPGNREQHTDHEHVHVEKDGKYGFSREHHVHVAGDRDEGEHHHRGEMDVEVGAIDPGHLVEDMESDDPDHGDDDEGIQETQNIGELHQPEIVRGHVGHKIAESRGPDVPEQQKECERKDYIRQSPDIDLGDRAFLSCAVLHTQERWI